MLGVLVNVVAIIVGSLLGLLFKNGISKKINNAVMVGVGLCVIYIGIDGMLYKANILVAVVSIVVGVLIGTIIDIDKWLNRVGDQLSLKISKGGQENSLTQGFVTASLLFCVGAMAIMGSITAGLTGDNSTLYTKSIIDFISSIMLSSALGIGVAFSIIPLFIYQGTITLCAGLLEPVLTKSAIGAITCVGSIIIMGLGFNITGISKFKIANYLPAVILAPFVYYFFEFIL